MYNVVKACMKEMGGDIEHFSIDRRLHQGLALNHFLFAIVINELVTISEH